MFVLLATVTWPKFSWVMYVANASGTGVTSPQPTSVFSCSCTGQFHTSSHSPCADNAILRMYAVRLPAFFPRAFFDATKACAIPMQVQPNGVGVLMPSRSTLNQCRTEPSGQMLQPPVLWVTTSLGGHYACFSRVPDQIKSLFAHSGDLGNASLFCFSFSLLSLSWLRTPPRLLSGTTCRSSIPKTLS